MRAEGHTEKEGFLDGSVRVQRREGWLARDLRLLLGALEVS